MKDERQRGAKDHVVLLHGLARTRRSLWRIEHALKREGYQVLNLAYPSRSAPVSHIVSDWLEPALDRMRIASGERVHFVTHSLGGIVFRAWACRRRATFPLGRAVLMAPPNAGSDIVEHYGHLRWLRFALGPAVDDLKISGNCFAGTLGPPPPETGVIMGDHARIPLFRHLLGDRSDGIVTVDGGMLEGLAGFQVLPVDHTFMMWRSCVVRAVITFLRSGSFTDGVGQSGNTAQQRQD